MATSEPVRHRPLGAADALLWTIDRHDPVLRTTVSAVLVLDRSPDWDELVARVAELVRLVPRLRSTVRAAAPPWAPPHWVEDPTFDLSRHLARVWLPGADLRALLDFAQTAAARWFDPELPLWEATLVEGMEGSRAAIVLKVHHAVADGVGGLAVISTLLDRPPDAAGKEVAGTARRAVGRGPAPLRAGSDGFGALARLPWRTVALAARALVHPEQVVREAGATVASAARLLQPAPAPCSPLLSGRSVHRRFEVVDVAPGGLRAAAAATGKTLNDVFVAGVLGGLVRYHDLHGSTVERVRVLIPVSTRSLGDEAASNHFVPARVVLPLTAELARRLEVVHRRAEAWKHAPALGVSDAIAAVLVRLPASVATAIFGSVLKGADVVTTDVPGPDHPISVAGARVEAFYAFAPPSGAAVNAALVSVGEETFVALNIDPEAVADPAVLAGCVQEGLAEVVALGRTPRAGAGRAAGPAERSAVGR